MSFLRKHFPLRFASHRQHESADGVDVAPKSRRLLRKKDENQPNETLPTDSIKLTKQQRKKHRTRDTYAMSSATTEHNSRTSDTFTEVSSVDEKTNSSTRMFIKHGTFGKPRKRFQVTFLSDSSANSSNSSIHLGETQQQLSKQTDDKKSLRWNLGHKAGRKLVKGEKRDDPPPETKDPTETWNCQVIMPVDGLGHPKQVQQKTLVERPENAAAVETAALDTLSHHFAHIRVQEKVEVVMHNHQEVALRPYRKCTEPSASSSSSFSSRPAPDLRVLEDRDLDDEPLVGCHYSYLLSWEKANRVQPTFLALSCLGENSRATLNNWLIKVQTYLHNTSETLHLTVALCDYFLTNNRLVHSKYQLLVITAYLICVKVVERFPPAVKKLCYLTEDQYVVSQVLGFEMELLHAIRYRTMLVTPLQLIEHMTRACVDLDPMQFVKLTMLCRYLFDLLLVDVASAEFLPSLRTAAAIFYSRVVLFPLLPGWPSNLQHYTGYLQEELLPCVAKYAKLVHSAGSGQYTGAYEKFRSHNYGCIALCAEIRASTFMRPL